MQDVAGDDHVTAFGPRRTKQGDHLGSCQRVKSIQRLIEDYNFRIVRQRLRQPDSLAHALAVGSDFALGGVDHVDALNRLPGGALGILPGHAGKTQIGVDELESSQAFWKGIELG